ncbi:MAG TPA: LysM peptidoglycan-binding domain-containing protein [Anaerolineae bacterium]|nr:LysM peptidoglycan-binding domain-containing protein [Anaerolineae bacterium]
MNWKLLILCGIWCLGVGCTRQDPAVTVMPTRMSLVEMPTIEEGGSEMDVVAPTVSPTVGLGVAVAEKVYIGTPTPDPTRPVIIEGVDNYQIHTVQAGETLGIIAGLYGSTVEDLMLINQLEAADYLSVGQALLVPGGAALVTPSFKLVPDSELVYGPSYKDFSVGAVANYYGGYLVGYEEVVEGQLLSGVEIVELVAMRFRVGPRVLLAALEYRGGWVTTAGVVEPNYPLGYVQAGSEGLYRQLGWAANQLNLGYYGRAEGGRPTMMLADGTRIAYALDINDGTAGVQAFLGASNQGGYQGWLFDAGDAGWYGTYTRLFGNPFSYTYEPLWPREMTQPYLALPWAEGETWYFTGGPHGGWAGGSAWAALDFVDGSEYLGCYETTSWVTAMADGRVVWSDFGGVLVDLDGDGYAGTGWTIFYMHLATEGRVAVGTEVRVGDRLGRPSCEGGFSNGSHVHVARLYNGRWISADGRVPFIMGGWVSQGLGGEYDGILVRGEVVKEACECRAEINGILHD